MIKQIIDSHITKQIGQYSIDEIDTQLLSQRIFIPIFSGGHTGEKVFEALKQGFNWMVRMGYIKNHHWIRQQNLTSALLQPNQNKQLLHSMN